MSKKSSRQVAYHTRSLRFVEPKSLDELAVMSDEELQNRIEQMYDEIYNRRLAPMSPEAAPWEVEIAYAQREQAIRSNRKVSHRQYLDAMRVDEVDESSLPDYQGNPPVWN